MPSIKKRPAASAPDAAKKRPAASAPDAAEGDAELGASSRQPRTAAAKKAACEAASSGDSEARGPQHASFDVEPAEDDDELHYYAKAYVSALTADEQAQLADNIARAGKAVYVASMCSGTEIQESAP